MQCPRSLCAILFAVCDIFDCYVPWSRSLWSILFTRCNLVRYMRACSLSASFSIAKCDDFDHYDRSCSLCAMSSVAVSDLVRCSLSSYRLLWAMISIVICDLVCYVQLCLLYPGLFANCELMDRYFSTIGACGDIQP